MTHAANAAQAPPSTPNAFPTSSDFNAVNTADQTRPRFPSIILANRRG
jgi:hypothetical protein